MSNVSITHSSCATVRAITSRGFTLIELIVVISVVAVLAITALDRLFWYQGQAEKAAMEYTATMIRSGLWMSAASLMMAELTPEIPALVKQNPINFLVQKPENYLGEIDSTKTASLTRGNWFYDSSKHQVIYVVKHRRHFTPSSPEDYTVRYGMKVIYGEIESTPGYKVPYVAGVTLVPLSKYTWQ